MQLRSISEADFAALVADAKAMSADSNGAKVLRLTDGRILKLFRLKHRVSSARFRPYAKRFVANAAELARLGIPAVEVLDSFRIPSRARDAVVTREFPGKTLREHLGCGDPATDLWPRIARFLAQLHARGILFRSVHFGNIMVAETGTLGLIDVADLRTRRRPLTRRERARNVNHFLRRQPDRARFATVDLADFMAHYQAEVPIAPRLAEAVANAFQAALADQGAQRATGQDETQPH